jgi:hypothetical protein
MSSHLNTLGIILTIVGAYLVWRYLTVISFVDHDEYLKGRGLLTVPDPTPEDVKRYVRSIWLSKFGLALVVVGGLLQIASNYPPDLQDTAVQTVLQQAEALSSGWSVQR